MITLTIATAVQFAVLLALAVVVLSLARQVGILHERLSPGGMGRSHRSLEPGEQLPLQALNTLNGDAVALGIADDQDPTGALALLFVAADCPICRSVLPAFEKALAGGSGLDGYWVADGLPSMGGEIADYLSYSSEHHIDPARFIISQELGLTLGVRQIPALALFDDQHRLVTLETLNGPRQVTRLLTSHAANLVQPARSAQSARPTDEKSR